MHNNNFAPRDNPCVLRHQWFRGKQNEACVQLDVSYYFFFFFLVVRGLQRGPPVPTFIKYQCHDPFMPHYEKSFHCSISTILHRKHSLPCQRSYPVTLSARGSRPCCVTQWRRLIRGEISVWVKRVHISRERVASRGEFMDFLLASIWRSEPKYIVKLELKYSLSPGKVGRRSKRK